jgi:hypothetical protein
MIYTNMTAMDNLEGIGMQIHMPGDDQYKELLMEMNDMVLFGETEIKNGTSALWPINLHYSHQLLLSREKLLI